MTFVDVPHNGKSPVQCLPSIVVEPSWDRWSETAKSNLQNKENHRNEQRRNVNIERHIPRTLIQRSSLCGVFFFSFFLSMCNITMCPDDGHQRANEIADKVKVSCVIAFTKENISWFHSSRLRITFLIWPNPELGYEAWSSILRLCLNTSYVCKQKSTKPGTVVNTSTRALSKHKLEFLIKLCFYFERERLCFVYTTIAMEQQCFIFRVCTNTSDIIDTELLESCRYDWFEGKLKVTLCASYQINAKDNHAVFGDLPRKEVKTNCSTPPIDWSLWLFRWRVNN